MSQKGSAGILRDAFQRSIFKFEASFSVEIIRQRQQLMGVV